jgi:hypothetical protein
MYSSAVGSMLGNFEGLPGLPFIVRAGKPASMCCMQDRGSCCAWRDSTAGQDASMLAFDQLTTDLAHISVAHDSAFSKIACLVK